MARSVNFAVIIGNVGRDAEVRYTGSGIAVATFTVATSETYERDGEKKESTQWHNITAWRKLAEICGEYVRKGNRIYVKGKITHRSYDDKEGVKKWVTEIVADEIVLLSGKPETGSSSEPQPSTPAASDDLPF